MVKKIISALVLILFMEKVEAQKKFTPLFDGKTANGWHTYGKATVGSAWKVDKGALHFDPSAANNGQGGDLVTDKEYSNFHLKLEWKVAPKSNSGIIFFIHEDPTKFKNTYETGLEMQVLDNNGHPDGKIEKHRAGNLYDLIKNDIEPVKAVGKWNTAEVICKEEKLTLVLNGITVVETILWDDNWKKLVAESKFKNYPSFGIFRTGKIALQDHGEAVWYKNIQIKEF